MLYTHMNSLSDNPVPDLDYEHLSQLKLQRRVSLQTQKKWQEDKQELENNQMIRGSTYDFMKNKNANNRNLEGRWDCNINTERDYLLFRIISPTHQGWESRNRNTSKSSRTIETVKPKISIFYLCKILINHQNE